MGRPASGASRKKAEGSGRPMHARMTCTRTSTGRSAAAVAASRQVCASLGGHACSTCNARQRCAEVAMAACSTSCTARQIPIARATYTSCSPPAPMLRPNNWRTSRASLQGAYRREANTRALNNMLVTKRQTLERQTNGSHSMTKGFSSTWHCIRLTTRVPNRGDRQQAIDSRQHAPQECKGWSTRQRHRHAWSG